MTMTTAEYEAEVLRTAGSPSRLMATMGLAGETGEVVDLVKKVEFHGKPLDRQALIKELGDVLWYLTALRLFEGITLDEVMATNVAKLRARYPTGFSATAANARADEQPTVRVAPSMSLDEFLQRVAADPTATIDSIEVKA